MAYMMFINKPSDSLPIISPFTNYTMLHVNYYFISNKRNNGLKLNQDPIVINVTIMRWNAETKQENNEIY